MKNFLLISLAFMLMETSTTGQTFLDVRHYKSQPSLLSEIGFGICTDNSGNVYVTGTYPDSVNFEGTMMHASNMDACILKYNSAGTLIWVKRVTGAGQEKGYAIKTDNAGNVYVAGEYYGTAISDTFQVTSLGGVDIFMVKLNSAGQTQWMKSIGSTLSDDWCSGIALDANNNIYMSGQFSGNAQFGNGVSLTSVNHPTSGASIDIFTAKFNNSGVAQWARSGGSIGTDRGYAIDVDAAGNSFITGFFQNAATFSGITLQPNGAVEAFVAGYNSAGTLQLLFKAGSSGYESGYGIALDGNGYFYITGLHNGFTLFDTITAVPNGSYDMFLAKYSVGGDVQWVQSTLSSQSEYGWSVEVDNQGSPHVTGYFYHGGTSMFNEIYMTSAGYHDIYIAKYNRHGEFQWASRGGTTNYDEPGEIAIADSGKVYITGNVGGTSGIALSCTFGSFVSTTGGANDMILLKLRTDITTGQVNFNTFCAGQAVDVPFLTQGITMDPSNIYTAQLSDKDGKFANAVNIGTLATNALSGVINGIIPDTMQEGSGYRIRVISSDSTRIGSDNGTNLTIHPLPVAEITNTILDFCVGDSLGLTAQGGAGYTYQWLKAFVPIAGAVSQTYYAKSTGVYNVIVATSFGCNRTSESVSATRRGKPAATITAAGPTTICPGQGVTLNANTGINYTYQWKKSVNPIAGANNSSYTTTTGGYYKCVVTNQWGCFRTSNKILVTISVPAATITPQGPTTFCAGDSVVLLANSGSGYTYQWRKYSNLISGAISQTYVAKATGNYKVIVTNSFGCTKLSSGVSVSVNCRQAGISTENYLWNAELVENPVTDVMRFDLAGIKEPIHFSVINALGQEVMQFDHQMQDSIEQIEIFAGDLKPGMYFIIVTEAGNKRVLKMIKE